MGGGKHPRAEHNQHGRDQSTDLDFRNPPWCYVETGKRAQSIVLGQTQNGDKESDLKAGEAAQVIPRLDWRSEIEKVK